MAQECLVYVNPAGIDEAVLTSLKAKLLADDADSVQLFETTQPYNDLLAMARAKLADENLETGCFYILNKDSAEKGAVLCVQTEAYCNAKGMYFRRPSAATSRRFYLALEKAVEMAINLNLANSDFEETAEQFGPAQLKRGERQVVVVVRRSKLLIAAWSVLAAASLMPDTPAQQAFKLCVAAP